MKSAVSFCAAMSFAILLSLGSHAQENENPDDPGVSLRKELSNRRKDLKFRRQQRKDCVGCSAEAIRLMKDQEMALAEEISNLSAQLDVLDESKQNCPNCVASDTGYPFPYYPYPSFPYPGPVNFDIPSQKDCVAAHSGGLGGIGSWLPGGKTYYFKSIYDGKTACSEFDQSGGCSKKYWPPEAFAGQKISIQKDGKSFDYPLSQGCTFPETFKRSKKSNDAPSYLGEGAVLSASFFRVESLASADCSKPPVLTEDDRKAIDQQLCSPDRAWRASQGTQRPLDCSVDSAMTLRDSDREGPARFAVDGGAAPAEGRVVVTGGGFRTWINWVQIDPLTGKSCSWGLRPERKSVDGTSQTVYRPVLESACSGELAKSNYDADSVYAKEQLKAYFAAHPERSCEQPYGGCPMPGAPTIAYPPGLWQVMNPLTNPYMMSPGNGYDGGGYPGLGIGFIPSPQPAPTSNY